jgi:Effector Associated Constant Component 1
MFAIKSDDQAVAGASATALADDLREVEGVLEVDRSKVTDVPTMDVGTVISVLATSGATLAVAQGLSAWLRARRGVTLTVEKDNKTASLKAAVAGIDPETAVRIVELIQEG